MRKAPNKGRPQWSDADYVAYWKSRTIQDERGCWLVQGFRYWTGYSDFCYRGKSMRAHRAMWTAAHGPIPEGLYVLHKCDVRHCVNPDHLWLGTISDNKQDELKKGRNYEANRTHCPRGHSYAEYGVRQGKNQWRQCRICILGRSRVRSGWPESLAYSLPPVPRGYGLVKYFVYRPSETMSPLSE